MLFEPVLHDMFAVKMSSKHAFGGWNNRQEHGIRV